MRTHKSILSLVALACGSIALGAMILDSSAARSAGWPHSLADLEGKWSLDDVRGEFDEAPPRTLVFSAGSSADLLRVTTGHGDAECAIHGLGRLIFAGGQHLEPLVARGSSDVHTMTHIRPRLPAWDHLTFFPDGPPLGRDSTRRSITYERD